MPNQVLPRDVLALIHLNDALIAEALLEESEARPKLLYRVAEEKLYDL